MSPGRPLDEAVTGAIHAATLRLLSEHGFARTSVEAIAREAGVGKPAVYRRFAGKPEAVVAAIATRLPDMDVPPPGPARERLRLLFEEAMPPDGPAYVALIGGLMAEHRRHPELIAAFRERLLGPRRRIVHDVIAEGQAAGEIRDDVPAVRALDLLAGPILARVFAGEDVGPAWKRAAFADWWRLVAASGA